MRDKNYPTQAISDEMTQRRYTATMRVNCGPWTDNGSRVAFKKAIGINSYVARGHDAIQQGCGNAMALGDRTTTFKFTDGDHRVEMIMTRIR